MGPLRGAIWLWLREKLPLHGRSEIGDLEFLPAHTMCARVSRSLRPPWLQWNGADTQLHRDDRLHDRAGLASAKQMGDLGWNSTRDPPGKQPLQAGAPFHTARPASPDLPPGSSFVRRLARNSAGP